MEKPLKPFLQIKQVIKQFGGVFAVDDVSLDIQQGEIFALLGSSGCGKSTLLRMLAGFETPTSGQIVLGGKDIVGLAPYERPINMMFQSYALFPHLSVWENVAFGLKRDGMPKPQIEERVEQMLDLVQLKAYAKRKPHQLSGGQQQRVAIARALLNNPEIILADEPTGNLDVDTANEIMNVLMKIHREQNPGIIIVTHNRSIVKRYPGRVMLCENLSCTEIDAVQEIDISQMLEEDVLE